MKALKLLWIIPMLILLAPVGLGLLILMSIAAIYYEELTQPPV